MRGLGGARKLAGGILLLGGLSLAGCASRGVMNIWVADESGRPIPGVIVTAGEMTAVSNKDGLARFPDLREGDYKVDAEDVGFKSCGPLAVTVSASQSSGAMLVMRIGAIRDGVVIPAEGDTTTRAESYSELVFRACPGRPDSAMTISTSGPKRKKSPNR